MTIVLNRIDDRLIHGQVVVGWGQPLDIGFIVLVDDEVAGSAWEQELYRMGVPPEMELYFHDVESAVAAIDLYRQDRRPGILLTGDIDTMRRLTESVRIPSVNVGGVHHRAGRTRRVRYVFLSDEEAAALQSISDGGVNVTAQDVPGARPIPLAELLALPEAD
jgi:mannose/fructose/N-acetylgalactosamine-specific phosphotransferase system component IIB